MDRRKKTLNLLKTNFKRRHTNFLEREYSLKRLQELLNDEQLLLDELLRLTMEAVTDSDLVFAKSHLRSKLLKLTRGQ